MILLISAVELTLWHLVWVAGVSRTAFFSANVLVYNTIFLLMSFVFKGTFVSLFVCCLCVCLCLFDLLYLVRLKILGS